MGNRVVTQLRNAKSSYFKNLNPKSNSKKFWSAVKYLNKKHNSIPVLNHGSMTANTNEEKAEMLNSFFSTCFNPTFPPLSPSNVPTACTCDNSSIDNLLCTEEEVYGLLSSLDVSKASGPDGISARMLKMTAECIAPSVCKLFISHFKLVEFRRGGNDLLLCLFQNLLLHIHQIAIGQSLYSVC